MAHGLDGFDGFSLILNGTRIRRIRRIFTDSFCFKPIINQKNQKKSVQSVCHLKLFQQKFQNIIGIEP